MEISNDIMKIVDKIENDKRDFNRCLIAKVCPKCGGDLNHDYDGTVEKYECVAQDCCFRHTR